MGIQCLNTFVNNIKDLRKPYELSNTWVVIDGSNFMYSLYNTFIRSPNKRHENDFLFGGNYSDYKLFFGHFFRQLEKCKVKPIMVFDGGLNTDLKASRRQRLEDTLEKCLELNEAIGSQTLELSIPISEPIFPYLLRKSLNAVMIERDIVCFQTQFDSDLGCAQLANELRCPLVSTDSDFLVMDIEKGVIDCQSFNWQSLKGCQSKGYSIECKLFKVIDLLDRFKGLKPEMLPIFATIMGNDCIDGMIFEDLMQTIRTESGLKTLILDWDNVFRSDSNERYFRLNEVLLWLSKRFFSAKQAIDYINDYLTLKGKDGKEVKKLKKYIKVSVNSYQTSGKTYLKALFDYKQKSTEEEDIPINDIIADKRVPNWLLKEFYFTSQLDTIIYTFIDTKVLMARPLMEDLTLESCFDCNQDLIAFTLGLLRLSEDDVKPIVVITRKGSEVVEFDITPKTHIRDRKLPILSEVRNISVIEREDLLFDILCFRREWIEGMVDNLNSLRLDLEDIDFWTLFLIVIKYWKQKTIIDGKLQFPFIRSIVLSLIYTKYPNLSKHDFKGYTYCQTKRFKLSIVHYYCELQACYSKILNILSLLGHPLKDIDFINHFNGVLVYTLMNDLIANKIPFYAFTESKLNSINTFIVSAVYKD